MRNLIIQNNMYNQIKYRENVMRGTVTAVNNNGTYNVRFKCESTSYPNVPTYAKNSNLQIGDRVTVLFENRNRELPHILAFADNHSEEDNRVKHSDWTLPTVAASYALIVTSPNEIQLFDVSGNLLKQLSVSGWSYAACGVTMDSQGNIYLMEDMEYIKKYDSNLNLLASVTYNTGNNRIESMSIYSDGYLYTLERGADYYLVKRKLSDLTVIDSVTITDYGSHIAGKFAFDSDGNWYINGDSSSLVFKYDKSGNKLGEIDVSDHYPDYHDYSISEYAGCAILGNYVYFGSSWGQHFIIVNTNFSSCIKWELPSKINYGFTIADSHLICSGWDADNHGATAKYDSNRNLIWTKKLDPITLYAYKAGGYNF